MTAYAFWNNKGGVGKSFLCFVAASEYAHKYPDTDVYVLDMCPQGNVSEMLLGGIEASAAAIAELSKEKPRATVAGYLEARLNSPFFMIPDVEPFLCNPHDWNSKIPQNVHLVCGDSLLEVQAEAIRQTSQLSVPMDSWSKVIGWLRDLRGALKQRSGERETFFAIDCNPSFSIYTQLALVAADEVVVPFTADDSSRRAIENVVALLYGLGDTYTATYARISFSKLALDARVDIPKLHTFIGNRITQYRGESSNAFRAAIKAIKQTMNAIHKKKRSIFHDPNSTPGESFLEIPDYHSASVFASMTGTPLHQIKPGPRTLNGETVQLNKDPLDKYRSALTAFVDRL